MAERQINAKFILRNDTAANWTSANPVLLKGEVGLETDTLKLKFGDGVSQWNSLKYFVSGDVVVKASAPSKSDSNYDVGKLWINSANKKSYILVDNTPSNAVWKQLVFPEDLSDLGAGDMLKAVFATNEKVGQGYVDKAILADTATEATHATNADNATNATHATSADSADEATHAASADNATNADHATSADSATKLATGRTFSITGDATGASAAFDGTENATINLTLANTGVSAGTYTKVTVDSKGRVTQAENLTAGDIPNLTLSKITDAGTSAGKDVGTSEGNIPVLGSDGKLDTAVLPAIAITDTFEADSETAMTELDAQQGDVCVRSDVNKSFILKNNDPSVAANWVELKTPTDAVLSVNGETGAVTLNTDKISEGATNQYFTEARATQNFNTNIAKTAVASLSDGANVLMKDDTFIFDGGNA